MILAQRGYQANSKTITVSDEVVEERSRSGAECGRAVCAVAGRRRARSNGPEIREDSGAWPESHGSRELPTIA